MRLKRKTLLTWVAVVALVPFVLAVAAFHTYAKSKGDGWLGVYIQDIDEDLMDAENLPSTDGVFIIEVVDDSPADDAGLKRGDVILMFDGKEARSVRKLTRMIEWAEPDEEKPIVVLRDGDKSDVIVTVGEQDDDLDISFFGGHDFHIDIPDPPSAPKAFTFSLGQISTSRIGVSLYELSDQLAKHYGAEDGGALINEVIKDGPAEKAGLLAGDVIVKMDGDKVEDISEIREAIQDKEEGEKIAVTVIRDGRETTLDVEVEESSTWSGIGDHKIYIPKGRSFEPFRWQSSESWRDARDDLREAMRDSREGWREWRDEFEEAMKELRQEMRDLKKELKEKGF